ncbi:hypothetical protein, partial [Paraburkholderia caribensis]|uniref:hypothetical protein n=1 Tax=Paraburkholderia caribensis TaxID=75105 RepID=UPI002090005E
ADASAKPKPRMPAQNPKPKTANASAKAERGYQPEQAKQSKPNQTKPPAQHPHHTAQKKPPRVADKKNLLLNTPLPHRFKQTNP